MSKQVNVQGKGMQTEDPDKIPPKPPEKTHEEKVLILLNRIYRENRTTRSWVAFMGIVLIISILLGILGYFYSMGEL